MKTSAFIAVLLLCAHTVKTQEFEVYPNGLIYNEQTMGKLSRIVDSLNLKFKRCELNKTFYSLQQSIGHVVRLDTGDIAGAMRDLDKQIPLNDFMFKHPLAEAEREVLLVRSSYTNWSDKKIVEIRQVKPNDAEEADLEFTDLSMLTKDLRGQWLYQHHEKNEYSNEWLVAIFVRDGFRSTALPPACAAMIGYSDCLIDTTVAKMLKEKKGEFAGLPEDWQKLPMKQKEKLLESMRKTRVVGFCSMDSRPREHAVNIALLSAETSKWEVFLKAHLDIMNDRFDRMSDGSYAWAARKTYVRELEELDINVNDLLLGTSFRMVNPASNHYYSDIGRLGRALAEVRQPEETESLILALASNKELDDFNRLVFYWLFLNYNHYLEDEARKSVNKQRLEEVVGSFPVYLQKDMRK